jgi:S-adenosylmethionine:tRNA ribosyltransferase-isomerase
MKTALFNYQLPEKLIANTPAEPRDQARLLVYNKKKSLTKHVRFFNLSDYLQAGDVLVLNNSKVMTSRLPGTKTTGGIIELLLLKKITPKTWEAMIRGKHLKSGQILQFKQGLQCTLIDKTSPTTWVIRFNFSGQKLANLIEKYGQVPIPPYIKTSLSQNKLKKHYQTVYAKQLGSAAAPTAGLHFTNQLLLKLKKQGVKIVYLTLHVGLGTFAPVKTTNIKDHQMHSEYVEVPKTTIKTLQKAKQTNNRIIAVGTTSIRAIEALADEILTSDQPIKKNVNIFIYPGYKFKLVDAIITYFHLPQSTLLMLVSAFVTRPKILKLYKQAIKMEYRFYSFGDAMFIF